MTIKALWQPVIWTIPSVELYGANGPVFDSPDDAKNWVHGFFTGAMAMPIAAAARAAEGSLGSQLACNGANSTSMSRYHHRGTR